MRSADWFADRFGLPRPVRLAGPVDRGYQGQIWRLVAGATAYAVKETFAPLDQDQVRVAYEFQTRAEPRGVLAPRQLLTVDGEPAAYVDGETWRIFEWVDLPEPDRDLDAVAVGRLLAGLHLAGGPSDAHVDRWYVESVGQDHWVELVAELRLAGAPFAADLGALVPDLVAAESIMEPPRDVVLCHRDLWADNVRRGRAGPVVIDWDNCGPASAPGELAMVLVEYGTTPDRVRDLYAAYRSAGGPARLTGLGDFTMPLAVLHHLVELGARQWLAAAGDLARQRAEARVREFTAEPTAIPEVVQLLESARF